MSLIYVTQQYRNDLEDSAVNLFQGYENLIQHQKFMALLYRNTNIKNVLVYQTVGSGKTISGISIINTVLNYINTDTYIYVLAPKTIISDTWIVQLKLWLNNYNKSKLQVFFYAYDQQNTYYDLIADFAKNNSKYQNNLFIVDECHNITSQMYKVYKQEDVFVQYTQKGKEKLQQDKRLKVPNAAKFYVFLQQLQQEQNNRLVLLTGTPIMKDPFEISLLLNLLHKDILPDDIQQFNSLYINPKTYGFNSGAKNSIARRIQMMIAFYKPKLDIEFFAIKKDQNIVIDMSGYQRKLYQMYRETENIEIKDSDGRIKKKRGFRLPTMLACNFTIPNTKRFNPYLRIFDNYREQITDYFQQFCDSQEQLDMFYKDSLSIKNWLLQAMIANNNTISVKEIKMMQNKLMECKSSLLKQLSYHSAKYIAICFCLMVRVGPSLVYSQFIEQEGLVTLILYLQFFGLQFYQKNVSAQQSYVKRPLSKEQISNLWGYEEPKFAFYSGRQEIKERTDVLQTNNNEANKDGNLIRVTLMSKIAQEGISFYYIRQIHIVEPQTNYSKTEQIEARGIRFKSHQLLPKEERYVQVFRYVIKFQDIREQTKDQEQEQNKEQNKEQNRDQGKEQNKEQNKDVVKEQSTDFNIYYKSKNQYELIGGFLQLLKESAMDCTFYNRDLDKNKPDYCDCFRLPDERYFDPNFQIYIDDYQYDLGIQQGSFSQNAKYVKHDVFEIEFIDVQGQKQKGLLDINNNIVYDVKYKIPISKIKTVNGFRTKNSKGFYYDNQLPLEQ